MLPSLYKKYIKIPNKKYQTSNSSIILATNENINSDSIDYCYSLKVMHTSVKLMIFHCILRDSKSPQVSRTLPDILVDLDNAVVWEVFTCLLIFQPFYQNFGIVPNLKITIGISITFIFHSFISSLARSTVIISSFIFSNFYSMVFRNCKIHYSTGSFFSFSFFILFYFILFFWLSLGRFTWPCLRDLLVSKNPREFCAPYSPWWILFFPWSNFNFFHNVQWINFPTKSCLV